MLLVVLNQMNAQAVSGLLSIMLRRRSYTLYYLQFELEHATLVQIDGNALHRMVNEKLIFN